MLLLGLWAKVKECWERVKGSQCPYPYAGDSRKQWADDTTRASQALAGNQTLSSPLPAGSRQLLREMPPL